MSRLNLPFVFFCFFSVLQSASGQTPTFTLVSTDTTVDPSAFVNLDIQVENFNAVLGYQFTLTWDPNVLLFNSIPSDNLGLPNMAAPPAESNFGISQVNNGLISCLWEDVTTLGFDSPDTIVFRVKYQALVPGSTDIRVVGTPTAAVVGYYDSNGNLIEENLNVDSLKVTVEMPVSTNSPIKEESITVFQNQPNPFSNETLIAFNLEKAENITFNLLDLSGKKILSKTQFYSAGSNSIRLTKDIFQTAGTYIYQIKTGDKFFNNKLVFFP